MKTTKWLLFFTSLSLPLYIVRCKNFDFCQTFSPLPFTLLEVFILATFVSWIVWKYKEMSAGTDSWQKLLQRLQGPIFLPLGVFLLSALVGALISADLRGGLGVFKAYFLEGFFLYLVSLDYLLLTKKFRLFLLGLVLAATWVAGLSVWQWLSQSNPFAPQELLRDRVSAVYTTSNAVGLFVGPLVPLTVGWFFLEFKRFHKSSLWKVLLIIVPNLFLGIWVSGSRGALLALPLAGLFLFLYWIFGKAIFRKNRFPKIYLAVTVFLFVGIATFFLNLNLLLPEGKIRNSVESRLCFWDGTKKLLADRPLQGSGLDAFRLEYPKYATCNREKNEYPHNIFLNFWTQIGLVGLLAFLWVTLLLVFELLRYREGVFLRIFLCASFVVIYTHGLVDVPFFKNDLSAQFWLLLAFGVFLTKARSSPSG
ncbi:MAG: O-antigen ligase family protein [bacterium]|nr:O-antigen ligase family protein [bacterium]